MLFCAFLIYTPVCHFKNVKFHALFLPWENDISSFNNILLYSREQVKLVTALFLLLVCNPNANLFLAC